MVALTCALVIFGVIMVFSASYYYSISKAGNPYSYLIKDVVWAVSGFAIMIVTTILDYHIYKKMAPWLMGISLLLLVALLIPGVGTNVNGATRWIGIGGITIMPGEISKICAIIFTAWFLCRDPQRIHSFTRGILPLLVLAGVIFVLIMKQPNMSTALTVVLIIFAIMFIAGLQLRYIGSLGVLGVAGTVVLILKGDAYRLARAVSFLDPFADPLGDGYQVVQGLLALGSGGLLGLGLGKSLQKNLYLPEPQNDFILAIIGEELGYLGILILVLVYVFLLWRGCKIVLAAPDRFGMLLGSGIVAMIAIQVMMNVAVVTSSMPATGVTLPFVSYGGNALWLMMGSMGILLNISRQGIGLQKKEEVFVASTGEPTIRPASAEARDIGKLRVR